MSGFVRMRPPAEDGADDQVDIDAYLIKRREVLAEELREVERILMKRKKITRLLCAPGRIK